MADSINTNSFHNTNIPDDWAISCIAELTEKVGSGKTPTGGQSVYQSSGRPFLRSQNIGWGILILDDVVFIDEETHKSFQSTEIQEDDVFLNITGASIGRSSTSNRKVVGGNVNQHVCIIRTIKNVLNPNFLNAFLLSKIGQNLINSFQAGGNRQGLNFEQIKSFKIPLPPLPEQRAIAACLSTWDNAIQKLTELIAQKELRKKYLMQVLLTGKKRLKGFKGDWKEYTMNDLFDRTTRKNITANENVVTISARDGFIKQTDFFSKTIASEITSDYFLINKGEFCYNKSYSNGYQWGTVKRLNEFDSAVVTTLYICFGLKDGLNNSGDFFEYYFEANLLDKGLMKIAHEGGRAHGLLNVTPKDFLSLKITIPQKPEQNAITDILQSADNELNLLMDKLERLKEQKRGLMQVLLTGKKRINVYTIKIDKNGWSK